MKRFLRILISIGLLLHLSIDPVMAETMYAKRDGVKVTTAKSPRSKAVSTLRLGEKVEILKKEKRQYQVKLKSGKVGWVFKFKLSGSKPTTKRGKSGLSGLLGRNTVVAKEARSGGSIRGLKESTETYAERKHINQIHRRSVDKMEALTLTGEELDQFQKEGQVGGYVEGGQ